MTHEPEPGFDRIVARALRIGAFAGFAIMVAAVLSRLVLHNSVPGRIATVGVLAMLVTPLVRVFVTLILFLRERDWKYSAIAFGVLLVLLIGAVTGIGER